MAIGKFEIDLKVEESYERKRGCGFRKPGGLYLVEDSLVGVQCGKLPTKLYVCPVCGGGIKPCRGWTWIDPGRLFGGLICKHLKDPMPSGPSYYDCTICPMSAPHMLPRSGLLWVGHGFYKTTEAFVKETLEQGISRRIKAIPKGFELGRTWVFVAHQKAINDGGGFRSPGVFGAFKPERIEYVVKGDESQEKLDRLRQRGVTLVNVIPIEEETNGKEEEKIPDNDRGDGGVLGGGTR